MWRLRADRRDLGCLYHLLRTSLNGSDAVGSPGTNEQCINDSMFLLQRYITQTLAHGQEWRSGKLKAHHRCYSEWDGRNSSETETDHRESIMIHVRSDARCRRRGSMTSDAVGFR
jgi:hypothetical protein